eukprot:gene15263-21345_t
MDQRIQQTREEFVRSLLALKNGRSAAKVGSSSNGNNAHHERVQQMLEQRRIAKGGLNSAAVRQAADAKRAEQRLDAGTHRHRYEEQISPSRAGPHPLVLSNTLLHSLPGSRGHSRSPNRSPLHVGRDLEVEYQTGGCYGRAAAGGTDPTPAGRSPTLSLGDLDLDNIESIDSLSYYIKQQQQGQQLPQPQATASHSNPHRSKSSVSFRGLAASQLEAASSDAHSHTRHLSLSGGLSSADAAAAAAQEALAAAHDALGLSMDLGRAGPSRSSPPRPEHPSPIGRETDYIPSARAGMPPSPLMRRNPDPGSQTRQEPSRHSTLLSRTSQHADEGTRDLADLNKLFEHAMEQLGGPPKAATGIGGGSGDAGGPIDISELWAFGSQPSASQSEQSSHVTAGGHEMDEVSSLAPDSRQRSRSAAPYPAGQGRAPLARPGTSTSTRPTSSYSQRPGAPRASTGAPRAVGGPGTRGPPQRPASAGPQPRATSAPRSRPGTPSRGTSRMSEGGVGDSLLSQFEGLRDKACTFKPAINNTSRKMLEGTPYPANFEDRIKQLSAPKAVKQERALEIRREIEEKELKECTFTPRTNSAHRSASASRVRTELPVHERLYQPKPAWEEKRALLLREREERVLAECTFRPLTNNSMGASRPGTPMRSAPCSTQLPLHERVGEVLRSRSEKLSDKRIKMELVDDRVTFQPQINRRSVQLAMKKRSEEAAYGVAANTPAAERLYRLAKDKPYRYSGDVNAYVDQECTFTPAINPKSRTLLARTHDIPEDFMERQSYLESIASEKKAVFREMVEEAECTFQPDVRASAVSCSGKWRSGCWDM